MAETYIWSKRLMHVIDASKWNIARSGFRTFPVFGKYAAGMFLVLGPASVNAGIYTDPRIKDLEARVRAQEKRIHELELKLGTAPSPQPNSPASPQPVSALATSVKADKLSTAQASPSFLTGADGMTAKLRGRLQIDAAIGSKDLSGTQIRRFYLGAEGKLAPTIRYQAEVDFAGNKSVVQDAFVGWQVASSTELIAGYFKPQVTADDMTSDVYTLFLERSAYAGVFAPGRRVGIGANHAGKDWGLRGGIFGERDDATLDIDRKEGWLASLRGHVDALPGSDVLHLAISAYYSETSQSDHAVSLSQRPEVNRATLAINTGTFPANHGMFAGGEIGFGHGPLTIQLEGGSLKYRGPSADPQFTGWSAQVSWRWTGEPRPYDPKAGIFGRVIPGKSFTHSGIGAIETGLRVTNVDLQDDGINGGRLRTYGAVLNWYPTTHTRLSANIIHAEIDYLLSQGGDENAFALRGAVDW